MATSIDFYGLYQFQFQPVAVVICGLDCGDYVVDQQGHLRVPLKSDPDGLFTAEYLQQYDVGPWNNTAYGQLTTRITMRVNGAGRQTMYVPVFIGYPYLCAAQAMRPITPEQSKSGQGGAVGKNRRLFNWGMLVQGAQGLAVGTSFSNLQPISFKTRGGYVLKHNQLFSGEVFGDTEDHSSMDGMLCWTIERPYPCTVNAITSFLETDERSSEESGEKSGGLSPGLTGAMAGTAAVSPMGEEVPGR